MADLLVDLYRLEDNSEKFELLKKQGFEFKQVLAPDRGKVLHFVKKHFTSEWADECEASFSNCPITCFIAVKDKRIVGFACYEATAKNFFGPTGVDKKFNGKGIGSALLVKCLLSMKYMGYAYAIIGGAEGAAEFYKKAVNAFEIPNSTPGIYSRLLGT